MGNTKNLIWFQIFFERRDLIAGSDIHLVTEFLRYMHHLKSPEGLTLFESFLRPDSGECYYISAPALYSNEIKKILSHFRCLSISSPNTAKLKVLSGKTVQSAVQLVNKK